MLDGNLQMFRTHQARSLAMAHRGRFLVVFIGRVPCTSIIYLNLLGGELSDPAVDIKLDNLARFSAR